MAQQTVVLPASGYQRGGSWVFWSGGQRLVDAGLRAGTGNVRLVGITVWSDGRARLDLTGGDLSAQWEANGSLRLTAAGVSTSVAAGGDTAEPYDLSGASAAFFTAAHAGATALSLVIDDGVVVEGAAAPIDAEASLAEAEGVADVPGGVAPLEGVGELLAEGVGGVVGDGAELGGVGDLLEADGTAGTVGDGSGIDAEGDLAEGTGAVTVFGAAAAVEAVGELAEPEGVERVAGDASAVESAGDVAEVEGEPGPVGDGAAVEGEGLGGEPSGVGGVLGAGSAIVGEGELVEPSGEPEVFGDAGPVEALGSLREVAPDVLVVFSGSIDDQRWQVGMSVDVAIPSATGNTPVTYSAAGLPSGVVISGGRLRGTPARIGRFPVVVTATDRDGDAAVLEFTARVIGEDVPAYTVLATSGDDTQTSGGGLIGVAGREGQEGHEVEWAFCARLSGAPIPENQWPSNDWTYDLLLSGAQSRGGETWYDGAPDDYSAARPYLFRAARHVPVTAQTGDEVAAEWRRPLLLSHWGQVGVPGLDGREGREAEWVFCARASSARIPSRQWPSNTWTYDQVMSGPISRGGETWYDGEPADYSEATPFLFRATRRVPVSAAVGDVVEDVWLEPVVVAHWGRDGTDGRDGREGREVEWAFCARTSGRAIPSSQWPSNAWTYDQLMSGSLTRGGQRWYDGEAQDYSEARPFLFRATRVVPATVAVGDAVADSWQAPALMAHWGRDGTDGLDGREGRDVEWAFCARANDRPIPSSQWPSNAWRFDQLMSGSLTRGGQRWYDGQPDDYGQSLRFLFRATRRVPVTASAGDTVADSWGEPALFAQLGQDGGEGPPGPAGADGYQAPGWWIVQATSGTSWASARATVGGRTVTGGNAIANAATSQDGRPGPVVGDRVTIKWTGGAQDRIWLSSRIWSPVTQFIEGSAIVNGSLRAYDVIALGSIRGNLIEAGTLTADRVKAGFFDGAINIRSLRDFGSRVIAINTGWGNFANLGANWWTIYDFIGFVNCTDSSYTEIGMTIVPTDVFTSNLTQRRVSITSGGVWARRNGNSINFRRGTLDGGIYIGSIMGLKW